MFLRKSTRKRKGKTYTNYLLVESVRTSNGPRQKTICSLGDLSPRPREEWLNLMRKVEDALVGQGDLLDCNDPEVDKIVRRVRHRQQGDSTSSRRSTSPETSSDDLVTIHASRVRTERHREAGPVHVGFEFWKRLGLDKILSDIGMSERARTLTCAMTLARLIHPCSEHAMPNWIRKTALEDILSVDFDDLAHHALYRNMDRLHPERETIETRLAEREQSLFKLDQTVFFYDLTSTYFEGAAEGNAKAKRGYSRDKRPDCKQVVVGLVVDRDGFPKAHEIFEGNTQDRNSLDTMLDMLDGRVGLKAGQTVVVDRGMAFDENLEQIRSRGLHYLVASRQTERDQWLSEFEESDGFEEVRRSPSPRNPYQKKSRVTVKMARREDETHVLCISEWRIEKDRAIREKKEKRLLSDLSKLERRIEKGRLVKPEKIWEAIGRLKERYPRVARYYRIEYDSEAKQLRWGVNEEKRSKAEKLDGSYLLKTDREDFSAEDAWRTYILLTRAEQAFRDMKSPLAERPIFHQIARRVETHIFLCVLAYHLLVSIEKTMVDQKVHTSWGAIRESLKTHQVCTVILPTDEGSVLKIRQGSTPETKHKEIYKMLGVTSEIMKPIRTWEQPMAQM